MMPELDAIKERTVSGLVFRHDHDHRRGRVPLPWITPRGGLDYLRATVKRIVRAAGLRDELSFTSFRHGGFTEGADSDLSDAELRAAGRHRSARQLPTYAKRTRKTANRWRSKAPRGANKTSRFVGMTAKNLSE
jgi:hypothetical protein